MITDIATQRNKNNAAILIEIGEIWRMCDPERVERDSLADLLGQVVDWRTELLDTVPFNGRRIQLLDRIIKNLETRPT